MSTLREQLIANVLTTMGTITKTAGYNNDVIVMGENLKDPTGLTVEQFPAVFVIEDTETKDDASVSELRNILNVIIVGYVKPDDFSTVKTEVRKLLQDIERAMCADRRRNNLAVNTVPAMIRTDHGFNTPYGTFELSFRIEYIQEYGTP